MGCDGDDNVGGNDSDALVCCHGDGEGDDGGSVNDDDDGRDNDDDDVGGGGGNGGGGNDADDGKSYDVALFCVLRLLLWHLEEESKAKF